MEKEKIEEIFKSSFDEKNFKILMLKMFENADFNKTFIHAGLYIKEKFRKNIKSNKRIGKYVDSNNNTIDFLMVNLRNKRTLEKFRTTQKNFIADYLNERNKNSAIVGFYTDEDLSDWRLSFVEMQYIYDKEKNKIKQEFTPAKRFSFLVGEGEATHTCCERFVEFFDKLKSIKNPNLKDIEEIFNVEVVTKEFYEQYRELYEKLVKELEKLRKNDKTIDKDFEEKNISNKLFCKKILGQIVFLYFIQKKGWLGVDKNSKFGSGDKQFLRNLFNRAIRENKNFFNDYLEHLFYEALAQKNENDYFELLDCRIPFLNGGLFEPIKNYNWTKTDIIFENKLFSNKSRAVQGDIGDGILDIFDKFNFTIYENEPLETEVAIDPEMLGKVFESMLDAEDRKEKGAFYTPKEIVQYMCQESLINYLNTKFSEIKKEDFEYLIKYAEIYRENDNQAEEKQKKIENGTQSKTYYESKMPQDIIKKEKEIDEALENIKVCDPAIGSGAFPVSMMNEIVRARLNLLKRTENSKDKYNFKLQAIENSIYGVDIEDSAVEIAKLRFWLSLIIEEDSEEIRTMPNLDYKIVCGNSLLNILNIYKNLFKEEELEKLSKLQLNYVNISNKEEKKKIKEQIDIILNKYVEEGQFDFKIFFSEVFCKNGGFDVIIANPPYVSNKQNKKDKGNYEIYKKLYGIGDDLYNYFFIRGDELLTEKGILCFITSNTFLTIESKKNIRRQIQKNHLINFINLGGKVFDSAVVDTVITIYKKEEMKINYEFNYIDVEEEKQINKNFNKKDFNKFIGHKINIDIFRNTLNEVFFTPNDYNMKIYNLYNKKAKELYISYYDKIKDSKNISKNQYSLQQYRESLKEGDLTLLGLITDGGVGLQTANNGKYIACLEGTKYATKIKEERWKKLRDACKNEKIINYINITDTTNQGYKDFLNSKTEKEIEDLFDELKENFGRDIFGQGYLFKIVKEEDIADVDNLTEEEKLNGIDETKATYVPYDKGDKDGNRWYLETPYYINWSKENVQFLKTDQKARWQGYQFYFKEGFTYPLIGYYLKSRTKIKSVHDVTTIILQSVINKISNLYVVSLLNSKFIYDYLKTFINSSAGITLSPRLLPIIIPTKEELTKIENIADQFIENKKEEYKNGLNNDLINENNILENELNNIIKNMYLK